MSFWIQALIADDYNIHRRIAACAASMNASDPFGWATAHSWKLAGCADWDREYSRAIADNIEFPGQHEDYITDEMILNAVTDLMVPAEEAGQQQ